MASVGRPESVLYPAVPLAKISDSCTGLQVIMSAPGQNPIVPFESSGEGTLGVSKHPFAPKMLYKI